MVAADCVHHHTVVRGLAYCVIAHRRPPLVQMAQRLAHLAAQSCGGCWSVVPTADQALFDLVMRSIRIGNSSAAYLRPC